MRYRPNNEADLAAHAGRLALLAEDVAEIPADLLDQAIRKHVLVSPYLPKASELVALAQGIVNSQYQPPVPCSAGATYAESFVAIRNASMGRDDIEWALDDHGEPYLRNARSSGVATR